MKIKVKPEDFTIEEIINPPYSKKGNFTLLKLQKRYWNTLDVIDFVARKLNVSKNRFSRAGLKDRYSFAIQYLSFAGDFDNTVEEKNFTLIPIGKISEPISAKFLKGNKFSVVIRCLTEEEIKKILDNYLQIEKFGFPNYFDEQRFGSARHKQGFFAKFLMLGHFQGALKSLLCFPYKEDGKKIKEFKRFCAENWGRWDGCLKIAPREFKKILAYLKDNPKDFKNAIKQIEPDMLNLYLLAYQSYLFNETLYLVIKETQKDIIELPYAYGRFAFYKEPENFDFIKDLKIPMLNEKTDLNGFCGRLISEVLKKEKIQLRDFKLNKLRFRGVRFKPFSRPAVVLPQCLTITEPQDDEIYQGKKKVSLNFTLPPGAYATILIKRLMI
uniref:tRNA pseudouridine(13) synthase TruD n=1 Tax=candidate division WOR-3 bacterium TaxID=2052148 RepID=A0A7V3RGY6_UNCW3